MLHPFTPSLILIIAALNFLLPEAASDRDLQATQTTAEVVDGYKYWGRGYCQDSDGNLYDFLRYDVSNTAAHGDISTPARCEARCPKTIGFLGFSVQTSAPYYYNNYELTYCYCWFDDGDVPTGQGEDYLYTGNSGTGVVTQTSFSNYAFCYTPSSTTPPHSPNQPARYVKISIPGSSKTLHIAEVEIYDAFGYNRAVGGIATQSSTYIHLGYPCSASYANDGDSNTYDAIGKICEGLAWTQEEDDPWWQVDLSETFPITDVIIINTYTQDASKLSNARVALLDASRSAISEANVGSIAKTVYIPLIIEDFMYVTDAPTVSSPPTVSNAPTPIPTLSTQPSSLPSSAPSNSPSLSSAPSDSQGPTRSPVIECSLSNPCPIESFCNYNYGEAGFCELCSDALNLNDCYSDRLTLTGAEECAEICRDISPASYDSYLGVPLCNVIQSACSTGTLTLGKGYMFTNAKGVGVESNSPNTLDGCPDGGRFQFYEIDESLDRIIVTSDDGYLTEGSNATITARVFVYDSTEDYADFFYSSDAYQVNWQYIGTVVPSAEGFQDLSIVYEIPQGSNTQAIRVSFRWLQDVSLCTSTSFLVFDDRDDLAFVVLKLSKYVRISLSGDAKTLSLAEVQAFDETGTNQALRSLGANATQSSTYLWSGSTPCPATIAIDNITESGSIYTCDGVTQTDTESNPWLLVELANPTAITKVVLWNRMTCCMNNLSNAKVELLDENMNLNSQVADIGSMNGVQLVDLGMNDFVAPASTKFPPSAPTLSPYEAYGSGLCSDADGYMFEGLSYQCHTGYISLSTCSNYCEELSTLDYWNHHNGLSFRQGEMGDICICHYDSNATIPTYDSYCWLKQESYTSPYVGSGVVASTYTDEGSSCYKSRCYPNCLSTPSPSYSPSISIQPTHNQPARYVKISIPGSAKTLQILEVMVLDALGKNRAVGANGELAIATQSSTYIDSGFPCSASYANDGDTFHDREKICEGLAWTQEEDDPWWQVDMLELFAIRRVIIYGGYLRGLSKLSNARVTLLDASGSAISEANVGSTADTWIRIDLTIEDFIYVTDAPTVSNAPSTPSPTVRKCLPNARKVRISAKPGNYLQLFLVQVFSSFSGSCLATGKSASQSSTLEDSTPASNAIGGSNKYHFSHTALDDESPWWEINLLENFDIQSVYIGQHMCKYAPVPIECFCHLSESSILLLDSSDAVVANYTFGKICAKRHVIDFNASSVYCVMPTVSEEP